MSRTTRNRLRLGATALLASALAAVATLVAPTAAQAHNGANHCIVPSYIDVHFPDPTQSRPDWLFGYDILSISDTFLKSEGRFVTNNTDSPIPVSFTSQVSTTFTISDTSTFNSKIAVKFSETANQETSVGFTRTLTSSTTTQLGVNFTSSAPPHMSVQGDYGVRAYVVDYLFYVFYRRASQSPPRPCQVQGQTGTLTMVIPTVDQGWQVSLLPA